QSQKTYQSSRVGERKVSPSGRGRRATSSPVITALAASEAATLRTRGLCIPASRRFVQRAVRYSNFGFFSLTTASGLLPAGTPFKRPAETNGVRLEIRYVVRR